MPQQLYNFKGTYSDLEIDSDDLSVYIAKYPTLLAEVPLLDNNGKFNGQYELRLMVALDVGGAIKGQHFDIYQGIGPDAGHRAGWYNHYGRVWVLKNAPGAGNVFSG